MQICSTAFLTIYGIGEKYWRNIRNHYSQQGISPRVHKLTGRLSNFSLSFEKILEILTFIVNYANIYGLPSPGRHFQRDTLLVTFLPASESYFSLYRLYTSTIEDLDQKIIHLTTFWRIWNKYIPEIKFLSPQSDLCFKCKEYRFKLQREQNSEIQVAEWNNHFLWAQKEREYYRNCIQASKIFLKQQPNFPEYLRPNNPNSFNFENHISWDYAEQVKIPFSSQQEGSIYFKSLYDIQVFGICEDAFPIQLRKSDVDNLDDLVNVVENSTLRGYNRAQTIFNKNGDHVVHFYNWTEYLLKFFKTIPNILKYHYFTFHMNNIGKVEIKEKVDGNTQIIDIKKDNEIMGFSREIFPEKLSAKRQWYLYEQIRQHIGDPQKQDEYCPLPNIEKPKSN
ncbi:hypothetical protein GLOIN_2v1777628 [Rhizophagus clarus]|uniref:Uncharacterized protein n=1 Tax=Rhizophagus clarus TaxID=94130 RepID=A0A8H3LF15_9GLOM|nr:hypothetical protein GLOIN_2v1777628 [Rhizophagus clarus]